MPASTCMIQSQPGGYRSASCYSKFSLQFYFWCPPRLKLWYRNQNSYQSVHEVVKTIENQGKVKINILSKWITTGNLVWNWLVQYCAKIFLAGYANIIESDCLQIHATTAIIYIINGLVSTFNLLSGFKLRFAN